jgi:hypothetical protein
LLHTPSYINQATIRVIPPKIPSKDSLGRVLGILAKKTRTAYSPNARGFGVARIRIFSQKSKKRVYPKLTEGNFGKLLRFLAVLEEQKIVSKRTKSRAYIPYR